MVLIFSGSDANAMPNASSKSELPDWLETERLPCLVTLSPLAAANNAVPVDRLKLLDPSPPVPTISIVSRLLSIATGVAKSLMALANPLTSAAVSPLILRAINKDPAIGASIMPSASCCISS